MASTYVHDFYDLYSQWYSSNRRIQGLYPYDDVSSRSAWDTSPLIKSAARAFCDNVIGSGLRLQATPSERVLQSPDERDAWARDIEYNFDLWARANKWADIQHIVYNTYKVQGMALLFFSTNTRGELEIIPIDPIVIDKGKTLEQSRIYNGIEINKKGDVIALHLRQADEYSIPMKRIPLYNHTGRLNFIVFTTPQLSGEIRGTGAFGNLAEIANNIEEFLKSAVVSAKVNASVLGYLRTDVPIDAAAVISKNVARKATQQEPDDGKTRLAESGTFTRLAPNEKIEFFDGSRQTPEIQDFIYSLAEIVGMSVGLPASILLKRFNKSYSASRAEILESRKTFNVDRTHFINNVANVVYSEWLRKEWLAGRIQAAGFEDYKGRCGWSRASWQGDTQQAIDPLKQASAECALLNAGVVSKSTIASRNGLVYEDELRKIERERGGTSADETEQ